VAAGPAGFGEVAVATPRKHWFRVADSVAHEPWSNDVCATFTRLLAHLNTRWARDGKSAEQACEVLLSRATAMQLTGSGSLARARSILRELATHVTLDVNEQGTNTLLRWPKFAKFQKLASESGAEVETDAISALPPPQDAPSDAPARQEKNPQTPVAAAPVAPVADEPIPIRSDPTKAQVRLIWPEVQKAAAQYGKRWEKLTADRLGKLAARLRDHGPDPQVLVKAVHGAVAYWKKTMPDKDMSQYIATDTIYGAAKFSKYLEFASDPKTAPGHRSLSLDEIRMYQREAGMI
jgi:hypothetical protein